MRFRDRIIRFMQGRNGPDQYSRFLLVAGLILAIISRLNKGLILYIVAILLFLYSYIRMFSKNISKRYVENQKYLYYEEKVKKYFKGLGSTFKQRKTHRIFKCPSCKQKIRIPKGKGKIEITCPKCRTKFVRKS